MINVAILGYGVVGSGVARFLWENAARIEMKTGQPVRLKRVLDLRELPGSPAKYIHTKDIREILNDPDIQIVVETMGGEEPALSYVRQALLAGKHVCTSNKELVAKYGAELLATARERKVSFLFEASVGGGIPVIRPLAMSLTNDEIISVSGILNGTTNYILSRMSAFGMSFSETLKEAQEKGFAEKNPHADVEGWDACRKLVILLSLSLGRHVDFEKIHTEGISGLTSADFAFARHFGYEIKLIAQGRRGADGVEAAVTPMLVHHSHIFYTVRDVFNCVQVQAAMNGMVSFHGKGAGMLPTAAAVVSDITDICINFRIPLNWSKEQAAVMPFEGYVKKKLARIKYSSYEKTRALINSVYCCDSIRFYQLNEYPNQLAFMLPEETEAETAEKLSPFEVLSLLRVFENEPESETAL
jgi:homoserine dehydrogenase